MNNISDSFHKTKRLTKSLVSRVSILKKKTVNPTDEKERNKADQTIGLLRYRLTTLGYPERALVELNNLANNRHASSYLRALASWELITWHMRQPSKHRAKKVLTLLNNVKKDKIALQRVGTSFSVIKSEAYLTLGNKNKARDALKKHIDMSSKVDSNLTLALANTYKEVDEKLKVINKLYEGTSASSIVSGSGETTLDSLKSISDIRIASKQNNLVSVIMPAFNAEDYIAYAAESILGQSWKNIELIVVDDCSTDNTLEIVNKLAKIDKRLKIIKNRVNSGAYITRNNGLMAAKGDFVTVADSDDWNHPDRIMIQAENLVNNKKIFSNITIGPRVTEDLHFVWRNTPGDYMQLSVASLMVRREKFINVFGSWDSVRFSGDSEMYHRIKKTLGDSSIETILSVPLGLVRLSDTSLTSTGPFGYSGFPTGARQLYSNCYNLYHQKINNSEDKSNHYVEFPLNKRPFYAPKPMRPDYRKDQVSVYDLVFIFDPRIGESKAARLIVNEILKANTLKKVSVGIIQSIPYSTSVKRDILGLIRESLVENKIEFIVHGERVKTNLLVVDPESVGKPHKYLPDVEANKCILLATDNIMRIDRDASEKNIKDAVDIIDNQPLWCFIDKTVALDVDWSTFKMGHSKFTTSTWRESTSNKSPEDYRAALKLENHLVPNNRFYAQQVKLQNSIRFVDTSQSMAEKLKNIKSEITIVMPAIRKDVAMKTAQQLVSRAGVDCTVIVALDSKRIGFIKTVNKVFENINSKYFVYLAEDAFAGRDWLKIAFNTLEESGNSLFGFNDGKWNGRIASFGMVRSSWAYKLYDGDLLYSGYRAHACDNELTVIARAQNKYSYDPSSVLVEHDFGKDSGGSNPYDSHLFQSRLSNSFYGLVEEKRLRPLLKEYVR